MTDSIYDTPENWPEDFKFENGMYQNKCLSCNRLFIGHKRRVRCRICAKAEIKKGGMKA